MIVVICGDRNWTNEEVMRNFIKTLPAYSIIREGDCRGADKMSAKIASDYQILIVEYPADWDMWGRAAGPLRNERMLDDGKVELVIAFHDDIENSKGTKDMVTKALKKGIEVKLINSSNETFIFDDRHKEWVNITPSKRMQKCLDDGMFVRLDEDSDNKSL